MSRNYPDSNVEDWREVTVRYFFDSLQLAISDHPPCDDRDPDYKCDGCILSKKLQIYFEQNFGLFLDRDLEK